MYGCYGIYLDEIDVKVSGLFSILRLMLFFLRKGKIWTRFARRLAGDRIGSLVASRSCDKVVFVCRWKCLWARESLSSFWFSIFSIGKENKPLMFCFLGFICRRNELGEVGGVDSNI